MFKEHDGQVRLVGHHRDKPQGPEQRGAVAQRARPLQTGLVHAVRSPCRSVDRRRSQLVPNRQHLLRLHRPGGLDRHDLSDDDQHLGNREDVPLRAKPSIGEEVVRHSQQPQVSSEVSATGPPGPAGSQAVESVVRFVLLRGVLQRDCLVPWSHFERMGRGPSAALRGVVPLRYQKIAQLRASLRLPSHLHLVHHRDQSSSGHYHHCVDDVRPDAV